MTTIRGALFEDESIPLDGQAFRSCAFRQCHFVYSGGEPPIFDNCQFLGVSLMFAGAARHTFDFLRAFFHEGFAEIVEPMFYDVRHNMKADTWGGSAR